VVEWKKQQEENGPPMEERLGEEELDHLLESYQVAARGDLNSSQYYRIIARHYTPRNPRFKIPSPP
jgi:hypothetical protein